jgi:AraC family transcriptional regulator of adaptative response/methylated-DNA-[protein]-cysteine methyltransferase
MTMNRETMYSALINRDPSFEGIFFVGVKSTGIFCRATCNAKKPKLINTEFFNSTKEALLAGYRPCKICKPMEPVRVTPESIHKLLNMIYNNPTIRIKDYDLRQMKIEPSFVRRWFKKNHGMTFQAFQRSVRIGVAYGRLKLGDKVTDTAFDQGYESLSGFTSAFKKHYGSSPKNLSLDNMIFVTRIQTPLGLMVAAAVKNGICLLEFADRKKLEKELSELKKLFNAEIVPGTSKYFDLLNDELKNYFEGNLKAFSVPIVFEGTNFQKQVWKLLRTIPYGSTRSYKQQADLINSPQAVRAVARANGDNRISIIIPCHRVIGSDGSLTGYGGGIWRKQYLLDLEKKNA